MSRFAPLSSGDTVSIFGEVQSTPRTSQLRAKTSSIEEAEGGRSERSSVRAQLIPENSGELNLNVIPLNRGSAPGDSTVNISRLDSGDAFEPNKKLVTL